jgi:toxin FitB
MYLADTNAISETRRKRVNSGVRAFFDQAECDKREVHLSAITVGELRRGIDRLRHNGDEKQASEIEIWLRGILEKYKGKILPVDTDIGDLWGTLRVPHAEPALDKLIAATALTYGLTVVTRNVRDFADARVRVLNPFD